VVHNPILGETFTAVRGSGALLNGQPIHASSESDLASALVATEVRCRLSHSCVLVVSIAQRQTGVAGTWDQDCAASGMNKLAAA
jgi:fructose-1,6-bisphosphatase/inositol monophosphatase family enzyme